VINGSATAFSLVDPGGLEELEPNLLVCGRFQKIELTVVARRLDVGNEWRDAEI